MTSKQEIICTLKKRKIAHGDRSYQATSRTVPVLPRPSADGWIYAVKVQVAAVAPGAVQVRSAMTGAPARTAVIREST